MRDEDWRSIALVLLGVVTGFIPLLVNQPFTVIVPILLAMAFIMIVCLLFGVGVLQNRYHLHILGKRRKQPFRIGILSDMGEYKPEADYYVWTDIGLDAWKKAIERTAEAMDVKIEAVLLSVEHHLDGYSAILNPYGGAYPEVDLGNLRTLNNILRYVREGGLFVNVADIPTYWAYSPLLSRKIDNTPSTDIPISREGKIIVMPFRPFGRTPLMKELGLEGFNTEVIGKIEQRIDSIVPSVNGVFMAARVVKIESNVEPCVPPVELKVGDIGSRQASSIVRVRYGNGHFLLSLAWINDESHTDVTKGLLRDALAKLTLETLARQEREISGGVE